MIEDLLIGAPCSEHPLEASSLVPVSHAESQRREEMPAYPAHNDTYYSSHQVVNIPLLLRRFVPQPMDVHYKVLPLVRTPNSMTSFTHYLNIEAMIRSVGNSRVSGAGCRVPDFKLQVP